VIQPPPALFPADVLAHRIEELGAQIASAYAGQTVICVGVLKGSVLFLADLVRAIGPGVDVRLAFLAVRSYEGTRSTGTVQLTKDLETDIHGQHVLLVEDIVDTGLTLRFLVESLQLRQPASLRTVALLDKPERRKVAIEPDWAGFVIPDRFVVGYGLDLDQRYRHLPYVGALD
jgi:hypoxanthine phosphoribosyltransferase